jgi:phage host-nuclease inhibitor protein Gam
MEDFKVTDDKTADWALTKIHEAEDERDRLIALAEAQVEDLKNKIEDLKNKCENETGFLKSSLYEYFGTVKSKETKTQKTYKLLAGTLVFKKPSVKINHDDEALLNYLSENDGEDFIKIKKSIDWAEFKKTLTISDNGEVIDTELGTVIPTDACSVEEVPASFTVKF